MNVRQLKRKFTVVAEKKNAALDSHFESEKNKIKKKYKKNENKYLFPTYYYFMDIFIDKQTTTQNQQ